MSAVAVDFDGVIHAYSKGWHDGTIYDEPVEGAFDAVRILQQTYAVFVHTSRNPMIVAGWLTHRHCAAICESEMTDRNVKIEFWNRKDLVLVTNRKLPAIAYIDDRAVRFRGSWDQAFEDLKEFER